MTPTPTTAPPDAPAPAAAYPPEVEAFCAAHGLREHLDTALRLAREVFPDMTGYSAEVVDDPDSPRSWVMLRVFVPPGSLAGRSPLWEFAGKEVGVIPADAVDLICLSFQVGSP